MDSADAKGIVQSVGEAPLVECSGTTPQQSPNWQFLPSRLMIVGLPGPEQVASGAQPKWQQSQCLLVKLGVRSVRSTGSRQLPQLSNQRSQRLSVAVLAQGVSA